ncbi:ABC transporter permease subunit [Accumulibacter sp.]|uniref:ABC transporter permease subunit n=1 Tax=Accumulibacter sp. TaxID=2053492 RepID=UPI0025EC2712|nr:ABC transporter permease subunit [Accumulibacter sp.]MCM8595886.1 ABC transporter permease subunit [Accumulibacter sp.]MCM8625675.1 ABC transporter permease subunit [Accumulibacter sp.]MDS4050035.1 ABC transporter permease subunit [Accumulibacter sp.]
MFQFALSGIRSGLRGRSLQAVFVLGLLLIGVAYLSGFFSPRQPQTVALDVGFSGIRFSLILMNLFWVQELVAREIDRRVIQFSLAYPVSRGAFLAGRFGAVLILSLLAATLLGLLLTLVTVLVGGGYAQEFPPALGVPFWSTMAGFALDAAIVAAFALCIAALSTVSVLPLALGAAFAIAGKALGATVDYLARGADADQQLLDRYQPLIEVVRWLIPDLSRLDWREWPMYQLAPGSEVIVWSVVMAGAYVVLLLALATVIFLRREFS